MPRRAVPFISGEYYHLYNRGVNREKIFFLERDYKIFLNRIYKYLVPAVDLLAYCLMPNHYHLLVRVVGSRTSEVVEGNIDFTSEVSRAMMRLSVSYTKIINHHQDRVGPLFQGAFQSRHIDTDVYLWGMIGYLHNNPVVSGLVENGADWPYSSASYYQNHTLPELEKINLRDR